MDKVFLSPHFDDVALSCGGMVAMAAAAGERVLVVTVCAALPPPARRSPWTDRIHAARGFADGIAYVSARREEDRASAVVLGTQVEWGHSLDAIYRDPTHYNCSRTLLGPPASGDPLVAETAALIGDLKRRFPHAELYAPLGTGHIDHRGVSQAARMASGQMCLYQEFPYRGPPSAGVSPDAAELVAVPPAFFSTWVRAVLCYRSQLRGLFGDESAARAAVISHAESTRGTRIWRI
ncbi:MAG TPA: PIG-L family deacetylase [Casimicrobiaceae bacterium]|nr:PIG-L family deacetylase [Casimicrobiaceae bacterium]